MSCRFSLVALAALGTSCVPALWGAGGDRLLGVEVEVGRSDALAELERQVRDFSQSQARALCAREVEEARRAEARGIEDRVAALAREAEVHAAEGREAAALAGWLEWVIAHRSDLVSLSDWIRETYEVSPSPLYAWLRELRP